MRGEKGFCGNDSEGHIYINQIEFGEEEFISPSYMIYYTGCNIRCDYCHQKDNMFYNRNTAYINKESVINDLVSLQKQISTISFLGGNPDQSILSILKFIMGLKKSKLYIPLVWNSNLTHSKLLTEIVNRYFDIFIADVKFGNDKCAKKIAKSNKYVNIVYQNILKLKSSYPVIIRHLPLSAHSECCSLKIVEILHDISKRQNITVTILPSLYSDNDIECNIIRKKIENMNIITEESLCQ